VAEQCELCQCALPLGEEVLAELRWRFGWRNLEAEKERNKNKAQACSLASTWRPLVALLKHELFVFSLFFCFSLFLFTVFCFLFTVHCFVFCSLPSAHCLLLTVSFCLVSRALLRFASTTLSSARLQRRPLALVGRDHSFGRAGALEHWKEHWKKRQKEQKKEELETVCEEAAHETQHKHRHTSRSGGRSTRRQKGKNRGREISQFRSIVCVSAAVRLLLLGWLLMLRWCVSFAQSETHSPASRLLLEHWTVSIER